MRFRTANAAWLITAVCGSSHLEHCHHGSGANRLIESRTRTGPGRFGVSFLIEQRWPAFYSGLVARSPFRAVTATHFHATSKAPGQSILLFHSFTDMAALNINDADAVVGEMERILRTDSVMEFSSKGQGPEWLSSPPTESRNTVVVALGFLNVSLEVSTQDALALLRARALTGD